MTHNVKTIAAIPLKLNTANPPTIFEVRGEVYMLRTELARINAEQMKNKLDPYKNTRNLTAGTLKLLDPKECEAAKLTDVRLPVPGRLMASSIKKQSEMLAKLKEFGISR